ncbi:hypothetical protein [Streptomyces swartbergensis]|uniref:hypothetical protein n=1 Tax=Streptomyces swartbergensis TaxID=487165 RepID=UPI0037FCAC77
MLRIDARWAYLDDPIAGSPYRVQVKWTYDRVTTGGTYHFEVDEEQANVHLADHVEITTPAKVEAFDPLWVQVSFPKPDQSTFSGTDLYAFALFQAPQGVSFLAPLTDAVSASPRQQTTESMQDHLTLNRHTRRSCMTVTTFTVRGASTCSPKM